MPFMSIPGKRIGAQCMRSANDSNRCAADQLVPLSPGPRQVSAAPPIDRGFPSWADDSRAGAGMEIAIRKGGKTRTGSMFRKRFNACVASPSDVTQTRPAWLHKNGRGGYAGQDRPLSVLWGIAPCHCLEAAAGMPAPRCSVCSACCWRHARWPRRRR
jgi:hypothetical protein